MMMVPAILLSIFLSIYLLLVLVFCINQCVGHKRNFSLALRLPYFLTTELAVNVVVVTALALTCILPAWVRIKKG